MDKINENGFGSLNNNEKRLLEKAQTLFNDKKSNPCTYTFPVLYQFGLLLCFCLTKLLLADTKDLYPTALMKHETQWLIKVLEEAHFNKLKIEDLNSTSFLNKFVSKLDKQKLYFTKDEVEGISQAIWINRIDSPSTRKSSAKDSRFTIIIKRKP